MRDEQLGTSIGIERGEPEVIRRLDSQQQPARLALADRNRPTAAQRVDRAGDGALDGQKSNSVMSGT
jgi:hypothetical protein